MQRTLMQIERLVSALNLAGLASSDPIPQAIALFDTLAQQPGADEPDHTTAHNAMVLQLVRRGQGRGLLVGVAAPAASLTLARLVLAGATDGEIAETLAVAS